jgi:hypothetical protein
MKFTVTSTQYEPQTYSIGDAFRYQGRIVVLAQVGPSMVAPICVETDWNRYTEGTSVASAYEITKDELAEIFMRGPYELVAHAVRLLLDGEEEME